MRPEIQLILACYGPYERQLTRKPVKINRQQLRFKNSLVHCTDTDKGLTSCQTFAMLNVSNANNMCQDSSGAAMQKEPATTMEILNDLRRVFQAINEYSKTAERSTGLTGHQLWALKLLAQTTPMRVSDLARAMFLRPPTVVGILDRLEAKGLITRTIARHDRRVVEIQLTQQAREIVAQAPEVAQDMVLKGLADLTDEQFTCVQEGMRLMTRMLGAEHHTPQPLHS